MLQKSISSYITVLSNYISHFRHDTKHIHGKYSEMRTFLRLVLAASSACPACVLPQKDREDVWQSSFISSLDCNRSALTWCERVSLWHIFNEMQRKACHHLIKTSAYEKCLLPSPQTPSLHLGVWNITFHVLCGFPCSSRALSVFQRWKSSVKGTSSCWSVLGSWFNMTSIIKLHS